MLKELSVLHAASLPRAACLRPPARCPLPAPAARGTITTPVRAPSAPPQGRLLAALHGPPALRFTALALAALAPLTLWLHPLLLLLHPAMAPRTSLLAVALLALAAAPLAAVHCRRLPLGSCASAPGYENSNVVDVTQDCRCQPGTGVEVGDTCGCISPVPSARSPATAKVAHGATELPPSS